MSVNLNLTINYYPEILDFKKHGFSYEEIKENLFSDIDISTREIATNISKIKRGKVLINFSKIVLLKPTDLQLANYCVEELGFYITLPSNRYQPEQVINADYIINNISNPVSKIKAKFLTRNFNLSSVELLKGYSLSEKDLKEINAIPYEIDNYFKEVFKRAKKKYIASIANFFKNPMV